MSTRVSLNTLVILLVCRFYAVIVVRGKVRDADQSDYDMAQAYTGNAKYYITAAWSGENLTVVPEKYKVGDESVSYANGLRYRNAELDSGSEYTFLVWIDLDSDIVRFTYTVLC